MADRWAEWILKRRHGGDPRQKEAILQALGPVKNRVLDNAEIRDGDVVLDVGAGDGLVGFGAAERVGATGRVIFNEISEDLLEVCRAAAEELGVQERCEFLQADVTDLSAVAPGSVDAVTVRSVLIYVADKPRAFREFHRVLRGGGRLSIFEPVNRFNQQRGENDFGGYELSEIGPLVRKVRAAYRSGVSGATDPMLDFDERDLFQLAADAGFEKIRMEYEAEIMPGAPAAAAPWETVLNSAPNPNAPTLKETVDRALDPDEAKTFLAILRQRVETSRPAQRSAVVYLKATRTAS